jgi:hypothetical protein
MNKKVRTIQSGAIWYCVTLRLATLLNIFAEIVFSYERHFLW